MAAAGLALPASALAVETDDGALPIAGAQHGTNVGHLPPQSSNMALVSKLRLSGPWGDVIPEQIADVSVHKGHAYLSSWQVIGENDEQCRGGFFVVDIRNPAAPKQLSFIPALSGSYHTEGVHARSISTPGFSGDMLALSNEHNIGQTQPACTPTEETQGGFDLWDVSDPANPKALVRGFGDNADDDDTVTNEYHSVFIWQDGNKAYAVAVDNEETTDVDVFDITDPRNPTQIGDWDLNVLFPQILSGQGFGESSFLHDMTVKEIDGVQTMLLSYWDGGYVTLNVDDPTSPKYIADSDFSGADPIVAGVAEQNGNAHYAEFSHDNRFILAADEDFDPYRFVPEITSGQFAGTRFPTGQANVDAGRVNPGQELAGPTYFIGLGCDVNTVPDAPSPDAIAVAERGACNFTVKAESADAKGYQGVIIFNSAAAGTGCETLLNMNFSGPPPYAGDIPALFVRRSDGLRILGTYDEATYTCTQGGATTPAGRNPGDQGADIRVANFFDGWGYAHLYRNQSGKLPEVDAYAIPEAADPRYYQGFGDLSIHEWATDATEYLAYSSYYSGGMRVVSFGDQGIQQVGAFIDEGGSNFWGVEQFTGSDQQRYIAGSDRDFGLYLFRYTGPGAAQPPSCEDVVWATSQNTAATISLFCSDPNAGNRLELRIDRQPANGTLSGITDGRVTYTPRSGFTGIDTFTYMATDGAANSAPAQVKVLVGRCSNPINGTEGRDLINGTVAGDQIMGKGGNDTIDGVGGADCLFGEGGSDQLDGGDGDDLLSGGTQTDRLFGGAGDDEMRGGASRDHLRGSSGDDRLYGDSGNDYVSGGSNNDRLSGGAGKDSLRGEAGNDAIFGGAGNDSIAGGQGANRISAGSGNDKVDVANGRRDVVRCGSGRDRVKADRQDRVARDCERVSRTRRTRG